MKTSSVSLLALALANATVLTDSFSIRQIFGPRGGAPPSRGGAAPPSSSVQLDAALVVDSSPSSESAGFGALSPDLALLDEPRSFTQQQQSGVTRSAIHQESSRLFAAAMTRPAPLLPRNWRARGATSLDRRLELPRHVEPDLAKAKMVMSLEMVLGRAAMVASVVLFVVELTTGLSLPDQLSTLL